MLVADQIVYYKHYPQTTLWLQYNEIHKLKQIFIHLAPSYLSSSPCLLLDPYLTNSFSIVPCRNGNHCLIFSSQVRNNNRKNFLWSPFLFLLQLQQVLCNIRIHAHAHRRQQTIITVMMLHSNILFKVETNFLVHISIVGQIFL